MPLPAAGSVIDGAGRVSGAVALREYLRLLDTARRMFKPDPEFQDLSILYMQRWNGFVEGPTWDAWWIQNSYGTSCCALPSFDEPYYKQGDGRTIHDWGVEFTAAGVGPVRGCDREREKLEAV